MLSLSPSLLDGVFMHHHSLSGLSAQGLLVRADLWRGSLEGSVDGAVGDGRHTRCAGQTGLT